MDDFEDIVESLSPVVAAFCKLGIRHYVGGSIASSFHGAARATMDVDLVCKISMDDISGFVNSVGTEFYSSETAIREAVRGNSCFNLIHFPTKRTLYPIHIPQDRSMKILHVLAAAATLLLVAADKPKSQCWDFEDAKVGGLAKEWSAAKTGKGPGSVWKVIEDKSAPKGPQVLAQTSSAGPNQLFNLCVADDTSYTDVDITVSLKANTGQIDQGGGPVWRYQDANNYYVCRHNPLEDNFRIYKVIAGRRQQLASMEFKADAGKWHTIRVVVRGDMIVCSINKKELNVRDGAIGNAGKVGLWTKADAVTAFDNFTVAPAKK